MDDMNCYLPEVSIIVPVYNVEKYLIRCIDSILTQTFTNFELILVDDGSTDKSGVICDSYEKKDKRIKVIHKKNQGVSEARNTGLILAKGKKISFVDSDDYIYKDMLKRMNEIMNSENADIVECEYSLINEKNLSINYKEKDKIIEIGDENLGIKRVIEIPFSNVVWNKMYKREVIKGLSFVKARICEDTDFSYKAILKSRKYAYTREKLYGYCYRKDSLCRTSKYSAELLDAVYIQSNRLKGLIKNNISMELIEMAEKRFYDDLLRHYILVYKNIKENEKYLYKLKELFKENKISFLNNKYLKNKKFEIYIFSINPRIIIYLKDILTCINNIKDILVYKIKNFIRGKKYGY